MKKILLNNSHIFFFIIFFILQLNIFSDYGFSWDEEYSRLNGLVSFNYVLEKLSLNYLINIDDIPNLKNYSDREYGSFYEIITVFIERIFNLQETKKIFLTRHLLNSIFFFIASIYFFFTLNKFYSKTISIIGFLIFISHPRIFAHSFYNSKDIIFLSFFCITNYYLISFLLKRNLTNLFLFSLFLSFTIGTRIMGIIIPCLFIFFFIMENFEKRKKNDLKDILIFIILSIILTIMFWPFLWENPLNIIESFSSMKNYDWKGSVFFNEKYYSGKYLPWYYLPVTIFITTPLFYSFLFFIGVIFILNYSIRNLLSLDKINKNIWSNKEELFALYSFLIIFLTIFFIIELSSTLYNGWRQVFFIYPSFVFISIFTLNKVLNIKNLRIVVYILVIIYFSSNFSWIINNHPYQYVYYNSIVSKDNIKKFELDYWGVSNLDLLKKINELEPNKKFYNIYVYSSSPYIFSLNLMNENLSKKYIFIDDLNEADYILTNHFYQNKDPIFIEKILKKKYKLIYEIKSNKVRINSLYKK